MVEYLRKVSGIYCYSSYFASSFWPKSPDLYNQETDVIRATSLTILLLSPPKISKSLLC